MTATERALRQIAQPPAETPKQWAARMQGARRLRDKMEQREDDQ